ncbi:M6 family metalloprotease domain protein [Stackebrandtia nassauensis DSM 44728]|uniref:M6 family metalloprotease domain protein n=1 Tax=Stackebrandtia nassauensis (strain DSM 44728 / CIP 108903 / NRRL B-16338 / NBRC 102104 / LLR-40K-21) TaxID=446470 RepID=D3Q8K2_STANL|nr:M6 family metalloprotease domain protein [Stackebrandtia nassauensis DSM 44728]
MGIPRLRTLSVIGVTGALVLGTAMVATASPTDETTQDKSSKKSSSLHGEDLPKTPLQLEREENQKAAAQKVAQGKAKSSDRSVKLEDGEFGEFGTGSGDEIFTLLVEFGDKVSEHGGDKGPLRNEIPEPDRKKDNSTSWKSDYTQEYYQEMLFGEGYSMTDFYEKQSGGQYTVDGTVEDWVKLPYNEARYGYNENEAEAYGAFVTDSAQAWYDAQIESGKSKEDIQDYLGQFDRQDRYDFDFDGDFDEPDGYVDHIQIIHAGEGEEAGGGAQGEDAIWSHRWFAQTNLAGPDSNPVGGAPLGDSGIWVGDYTTEPENGGLGVFTHEFGHDLGLPDLYATQGAANSTGRWTLMSGGSWLNDGKKEIGNRPGYMGPWEKWFLGWLDYDEVEMNQNSKVSKLGAAGKPGSLNAATKVNLPDETEEREYAKPSSGEYEWMFGEGDDLNSSLSRELDLTAAKDKAEFTANTFLDTEEGYDYFFAEVSTDGGKWKRVGDKHSGSSGEFKELKFDLSEYAGQKVQFRMRYQTDGNTHGTGVFVDDLAVVADGEKVWSDDVEGGDNGWTGYGAKRTTGKETLTFARFYLVENRQHVSYDKFLKTGPYNFGFANTKPDWVERYRYEEGMLVWFVNTKFGDNNTGLHPGQGLALPVDAHAKPLKWSNGQLVHPTHQSFDSPFSLNKTKEVTLHLNGKKKIFVSQKGVGVFDDSDPEAYWSKDLPNSSVKVAGEGIKVKILDMGDDEGAPMKIQITRS